jgi:hypothetical protein
MKLEFPRLQLQTYATAVASNSMTSVLSFLKLYQLVYTKGTVTQRRREHSFPYARKEDKHIDRENYITTSSRLILT